MNRKALADVAACMTTLFLSFWLYEVGNWASLTAAGAKASLAWNGVIPVGVFAVSQGEADLFGAKLLQTGFCVGVSVVALGLIRGRELQMTTITLGALVGIYTSSIYWEILSLTGGIPLALHELVFGGLSLATGAVVLKTLGGTAWYGKKSHDFPLA